ncbi:MAG: DNA adenine methylase, partial [Proteobacteria bacterium]
MAKPFLKWAGGKTQLIEQIEKSIPESFHHQPFTYIEPFSGSAAVFFWMQEKFPNMEKAVLNDINIELIDCFKVIKNNVSELIDILKNWESEFHDFDDDLDLKKEYYYKKRTQFNSRESSKILQSALFIF